jgi:hypothetical protein
MANPFDSAWALLKGINHDEQINWNQAVPTENQIGPNGEVKQERGFGLSHYTNPLPKYDKAGWENSLYKVPWEQEYYKQMMLHLENHVTQERGEHYNYNNLGYVGKTLSPEQIEQLQNDYNQIVPTEHQLPAYADLPELVLQNMNRHKQERIDTHKAKAAFRREREKMPENIFARKRN